MRLVTLALLAAAPAAGQQMFRSSAGMRRIFASNFLLLPASDELVVAALALRRLRSRSSDGNEQDQLEGASHVRSALDCLHRRRRYGGCRTLQGRAQGDRGL